MERLRRWRRSTGAQRIARILPALTVIAFATALAAAALGRWIVERDATAVTAWDPTNPRPAIDAGPLGFPWALFLLPFAIYAVWLLTDGFRARGSAVGADDAEADRMERAARGRWIWQIIWVAYWIAFLLVFTIGPLRPGRDPFLAGSTVAPGPAITEIRASEGTWYDEALGEQVSFDVPGSCDDAMCPAPRFVAKVRPGELVTYLVTVRNTLPVGLAILGSDSRVQLGLPRDPAHPSADPAEVVPFHPITLAGGAELAVVIGRVAGPCADPAATVPRPVGYRSSAYGFGLIYDILGWWREAAVYPPVEVTIPGEDASSCASDRAP